MHTHYPSRSPYHDAAFWLQDLRLGRYREIVTHLADRDYRVRRIASLFRTRRVLEYVAGQLGVQPGVPVAELQERIADHEELLLPYLLVGAFSPHKAAAAVIDAAEAALTPEALQACRDARGEYDRLLLLLHLVDHRPDALAHVRGLHVWHRHGAVDLVLAGAAPHVTTPLLEMLTADRVERAIADVPRPTGVPPIRFEMTIPRGDGEALLLLRRNLRRAHNWSDDGTQIHHGHDEEVMVLHFIDGGARVRVSAQTSGLPRRLAEAIVSAWTGTRCAYVDDLVPAEPASLQRMLAALLSRQVDELRLVELAVREAPLDGAPELILRTSTPEGDITGAIAHFERQVGPLLDRLADIVHLRVVFRGRRVEVCFPVVGGRPVARFADGRLDRHAAEAFRAFVGREFGLPLHSMESVAA